MTVFLCGNTTQSKGGVIIMDGALPNSFIRNALDALVSQICIIDAKGTILYVNQSWREFGLQNGMLQTYVWEGTNYFIASSHEDPMTPELTYVLRHVQDVADGKSQQFEIEYPCDSPFQRRWFLMTASHFRHNDLSYSIIKHTDITKRKLMGENAEILAHTDPLTGLANRRGLEKFLNQEWKRGVLSGNMISVLMIDIDHFKHINDQYGHVFGDRCLSEISRLIRDHIWQSSDCAARYGGEEFAVVLPNLSPEVALKKACHIAEVVRNAPFNYHEHSLSLTISIGVHTAIPTHDSSEMGLIECADIALINAKNAGRNCVRVYQ